MMGKQFQRKKRFDSIVELVEYDQGVIQEIDDKYVPLIQRNDEKKKDIINKYAEELKVKGDMPTRDISTHLTEKLKGYASARWIQESLDDDYKNPDKQNHGRRGSSPLINPSDYKIENIKRYRKSDLVKIVMYLDSLVNGK